MDKSNPIMKDMSDITIFDEAFFTMTWAKDPGIHVLATARSRRRAAPATTRAKSCRRSGPTSTRVAGGQPARAFVWMQGHTYANFANYQIQRTLLRGIAWAGKKPVDELVNYVAPPRPASARNTAGGVRRDKRRLF